MTSHVLLKLIIKHNPGVKKKYKIVVCLPTDSYLFWHSDLFVWYILALFVSRPSVWNVSKAHSASHRYVPIHSFSCYFNPYHFVKKINYIFYQTIVDISFHEKKGVCKIWKNGVNIFAHNKIDMS